MPGNQKRGRLNWQRRIESQKRHARSRGEEIGDAEAHRREVAKFHRPKLRRLYNPDPYVRARLEDGTEILVARKVELPPAQLELETANSGWNWDRYFRGLFDPGLYEGTEIELSPGRVALPNCVPLEPLAVHASRNYGKITIELARMIEERKVKPEEIRFMCSEFFIFWRNAEDFLVRFGTRRFPAHIDEQKLRVCYVDGTVTLDGNAPIRGVKSVAVFDYYLGLYRALCRRPVRNE